MADVDYAALAAQARSSASASPPAAAGTDYAALASQARGEAPPDFTVKNATDADGHTVVDSWTDKAVKALPWLGGLIGGIGGGIGGSVFGVGVGGVPGAVGGAAFGGASGEAAKELIDRARGKLAPSSSTEAAKAIGTAAAIQGAGELAGQGVAKVGSALAPRIMQAAVKPGLKTLRADVAAGREVPKIVQTLLDEGINVTHGGLEKLHLILEQTNDTIKSALSSATGKIDPFAVSGALSSTVKRFGQQVAPSADIGAIAEVGKDFLESHPNALSVTDAQALKSGTYQQIRNNYGKLSGGSVEAQKALARGLREAIEAEAPQVAGLNAKEAGLIQAIDAVGKRVALAGNHDPVGFAWVAHNPTTFLAALFDRSPIVKSLIARGMYVPAGQVAKVAPELIRTAVSALASTSAPPADALPAASDGK